MLLFLVAGFETVSTTLVWFIHLASKNPCVQQKIKMELMNSGNDQDLTIERLDSLVYLDAVINEVLRFAPPAIGTNRTLMADDRLPQSGVQLYKGEQVHISFYSLSHDPRYWSIDPESFYPERFLAEDKNYQPYANIPFGEGHRQCIGQDLARLELKAVIARLMQNVTFGDGGPELNSGGHFENITTQPHHVGVTIEFDH
jgi:cytochrome P450